VQHQKRKYEQELIYASDRSGQLLDTDPEQDQGSNSNHQQGKQTALDQRGWNQEIQRNEHERCGQQEHTCSLLKKSGREQLCPRIKYVVQNEKRKNGVYGEELEGDQHGGTKWLGHPMIGSKRMLPQEEYEFLVSR